ncbi:MAG TPA: putative quinol monooxygenase [Sphingobium sp.]|uniref:putative quinol monooxygenase n=1 Tax=Sphingobium sp. TaxID=1912891 RepID=UPI002ED050B8
MAAGKKIVNIVGMRARPGGADALDAALRLLVGESRKEGGCEVCLLHRSSDDADLFMVYERWTDAAALDAHMEATYVADFLARLDELLSEPPDVRPFTYFF